MELSLYRPLHLQKCSLLLSYELISFIFGSQLLHFPRVKKKTFLWYRQLVHLCIYSSETYNKPTSKLLLYRKERSTERTDRLMWMHFTCHLFDAAQGVLEGVQCRGLVIVSLLRRQVKLQLFQGFNHLLLGLGFGRFLTTAICTYIHTHTHTCAAASQIESLKARLNTMKLYLTLNSIFYYIIL